MKRAVTFTLTLSLLLPCPTYAKDNIAPDEIVTYKEVGDAKLKLHVFRPQGHQPSDKRAAIIFFFGGGWTGGTPRQFYQQAKDFAALGVVAFSAEYRVKSVHNTSPIECVKDGKSAVRWIRAHATALGVDSHRIIAAGGSAGGHVAACTGVIQSLDESEEDLDVSSVPNAMILSNPVIDTTENGYGVEKFDKDRTTEVSPCHHIRKGIAPTLIFHGTADETVPFENVERFTRLMKAAGNQCVLVPFEGKTHGFFNGSHFRAKNGDEAYNTIMKQSIDFLTEHGLLSSAR